MARNRDLRNTRRPLGWWDRIPAGIRSTLISSPLLLILFVANSVAAGVFATTGFYAALICYPIQLAAYILNGMLSGWFQRNTFNKANRRVGFSHETARYNRPEYLPQGVVAGVLLGLVGLATYALIYVAAEAAAASLLPGVGLFSFIGGSAIIFLFIDYALCIGAGVLGALIFDRFLD